MKEPGDGRTDLDKEAIKSSFLDDLFYMQGKFPALATENDYYMALAYAVRDRMLHRWISTAAEYTQHGSRTVAYLSAEFLMGPHLGNNLLNLGILEQVRECMTELGLDFDELLQQEEEPGLGSGGLGRLAACFIDSLATLEIPALGYGIRYEFGIFHQEIVDGWQMEKTDKWLRSGNPWELIRPEWAVSVKFGGYTEKYVDEHERLRVRWVPHKIVHGIPYDTLILGYRTNTANTLRLWRAEAPESFDFAIFNSGDYYGAVNQKVMSENLSKVLYPNDEQLRGKELRLEQQYFFVSCSIQDMFRILRTQHLPVTEFHEKFAVQLNDTHPAIAIAELMRLFIDEHSLAWDEAWSITRRTFAYTNHTLLPEALERWSLEVFGRVLPRHLEIIYDINAHFLQEVRMRFLGDDDRIRRMSIIDENGERYVRMATSRLRRQPCDQRRGGTAYRASQARRAQGFQRAVAVEVQQQDQRRNAAALDGALQSPPVEPHHRAHRRRLDQGSGRTRAPRAVCRRSGLPRALARDQAGQQAQLRRPGRGAHRDSHRSRLDVRRPGEADPRIQASALEGAAHRVDVSRHQVEPVAPCRAAHLHLRRQGRPRLPPRQAHDQADHGGRRRDQPRPRRTRPPAGGVPAEFQRHQWSARVSGRGSVGADFDRRQGSLRHRQHEVLHERRAHHRHPGRREHRAARGDRRRQFLSVRT